MIDPTLQIFVLLAGYAFCMDLVGLAVYYKIRQLRKKYLGKTALFYCFDVNPTLKIWINNTERYSMTPIWRARIVWPTTKH